MAKYNNIPKMSDRQWDIRNAFVERLLKQSKNENKKLSVEELKQILKIYDDNKLYKYVDSKTPIPQNIVKSMDNIYFNAKTLTQKEIAAKNLQNAVNKFRVALPTKPNTVGLKMNRTNDDDYILQEVAQRRIKRWGKTVNTKQFTDKELAKREAIYDPKYRRLVNYNNAPASTTGVTSKKMENTKAFVFTADGKLYTEQHLHMAEKDGKPVFTHAALGDEKPVKLAGMIKIDDYGRIYHIDTFSGHYRPELSELYKAIKDMQKNMPGVFATNFEIEFTYNNRDYKYNLSDFIRDLEKPGKTGKPFWKELEDNKQLEKQAYYNKIQNTKSIAIEIGRVHQSIEQQKDKIAKMFNDSSNIINVAYIKNDKYDNKVNHINMNLETFIGQVVKDNNIEVMQSLLDAGISKRTEFKNVLPIIRNNTSMSDFVRNYKPQEVQIAKATTARERRRARLAEEAEKKVLPTEPIITTIKDKTTREPTKVTTIQAINVATLEEKRRARRGLPPITTTEATKRPLPAIEPVNNIVHNANKPLANIKNPGVINIEKPKQTVGQRLAERFKHLKETFLEKEKEDNNIRKVANNNQNQNRGGRNIF